MGHKNVFVAKFQFKKGIVWPYRFNIYQWTASHLTKSFVV